jgi:hypothetical protein
MVTRHRSALVLVGATLAVVACASGHADDGAGGAVDGADALTTTGPLGPFPTLSAAHLAADEDDASAPPITIDGDGSDDAWSKATAVTFDTQWSGVHTAFPTHVRALWSSRGLYMLWEIDNTGLNVDTTRPVDVERENLFQEDCVEVFVAPDPAERRRYFEIELGPFGHFFDLKIDRIKGTSDESWSSQAEIKTSVDRDAKKAVIEVALRSPDITSALKAGLKLPMNMFRMEGTGTRQFLAWSPTKTPRPNFHVPEAFGSLSLLP